MALITQSNNGAEFSSLLAPFTGVNNGSARLLKAISAGELATLREGNLVYVMSIRDYWKWLPNSTITSNDITYCAPTIVGAGAGRFERMMMYSPDWQQAANKTVFVDELNTSTFANDENDGLTNITPLLNDDERRRRWGPAFIYQPSVDYHVRVISTATDILIEGFFSLGSSCYVHASTNDREGVTPPLYSGTISAFDTLNTAPIAAAIPYAIRSDGLAVNWAGLIDKRGRVTSGANINTLFWATLQDAVTPKKARITETIAPVASFTAVPFVAPASTQTPPAVADTFVIEDLRTVTRLEVTAAAMPGASPTSARVICDSLLISSLILSPHCGIYLDGCQVTTSFVRGSFTTYHQCKPLSISDDGLKSIIGGYSTTSLTLINNCVSNCLITNWTVQGARSLMFSGSGNQGSPDTWRPNQIGFFDTITPTLNYFGQGVRLNASTLLYGAGNTSTIIALVQNAVGIVQQGIWAQPVLPAASAFVTLAVGPARTSCEAHDQITGLQTAPILMSQTNMGLAVAAGGLDYTFIDPVSGAGFAKY